MEGYTWEEKGTGTGAQANPCEALSGTIGHNRIHKDMLLLYGISWSL